ncbi:AAA family ATPase [Hyphomicrobium sp.]|uniref:nucleotide-binding protein n=1 Tax=Hyphomicrobium sp. TaxID=82 RepID=UPI002E2EDCAD|nr:AAA family ATPase [Hyphomicrobium sp.]HEX2842513.1 AAA family ATPase [Hyphomicrobium sp.]
MLYVPTNRYRENPDAALAQQTTLRDDIWWMFATVLSHWKTIAAIFLVFTAGATAFVLMRTPAYTASAQVQISNLRLLTSRDDTFFVEAQLEPRFLETQLQILRSERVGYSVVDQLNLTKRFGEKPASVFSTLATHLSSLLGLSSQNQTDASEQGDAADARRRAALRALQQGFSAEQVGLSEVVELRFTSDDRELSALVANDLVRAYLAEQEAARSDSAQAGSSWLRERLREVGPRARILTAAYPPLHSSNLRGILIIGIASVLGLVLGAFAALCRGLLDRTVRTPEDVSAASAGKFLGIVSHGPLSEHSGAASAGGAPPPEWYTFREIIALWDREPSRRGLRTLGVVSTQRGEGRSLVAAELARNLAANGRRVLLIDADPAGSHATSSADHSGFAQWLDGQIEQLRDVVVTDGVGGVDCLSSGMSANFGTIDWGPGMTRLVEAVAPDYDYVIFDLPPLSSAADVGLSTAVIGDYLLVVGSGSVEAEHIDCALASLPAVRAKLIGYVLNNVDLRQARWLPSVEIDLIRRRSLLNTPFSVRRAVTSWARACRSLPRKLVEKVRSHGKTA